MHPIDITISRNRVSGKVAGARVRIPVSANLTIKRKPTRAFLGYETLPGPGDCIILVLDHCKLASPVACAKVRWCSHATDGVIPITQSPDEFVAVRWLLPEVNWCCSAAMHQSRPRGHWSTWGGLTIDIPAFYADDLPGPGRHQAFLRTRTLEHGRITTLAIPLPEGD